MHTVKYCLFLPMVSFVDIGQMWIEQENVRPYIVVSLAHLSYSSNIATYESWTVRMESKKLMKQANKFGLKIYSFTMYIHQTFLTSECETPTLMLCIFSPLPLSKPAQMLHKFGKVDQFLQFTSNIPHWTTLHNIGISAISLCMLWHIIDFFCIISVRAPNCSPYSLPQLRCISSDKNALKHFLMPYFDTMILLKFTDYIKPDSTATNLTSYSEVYCTWCLFIALHKVALH